MATGGPLPEMSEKDSGLFCELALKFREGTSRLSHLERRRFGTRSHPRDIPARTQLFSPEWLGLGAAAAESRIRPCPCKSL